MRAEITQLLAFGILPDETSASSELAVREALIHGITPPVTLVEAKALAGILGRDDCFGLAWSILHLIESAPGWGSKHIPLGPSPFLATLRARAMRPNAAP